MKKLKLFYELSKPELIDAITYFPSLEKHADNRLKEEDLKLIKNKQSEFNDLPDKEKAISLIEKYFDLDKYGDLTELSKLDWATQLSVRKKILALLDPNNSTKTKHSFERIIFTLFFQNPILSEKLSHKRSTKNISDLTVNELFSIFKIYKDNNLYDLFEANIDTVGPDIFGEVPSEDIYLVNAISKPVDLYDSFDSRKKVVATVDLSINDQQLENEFKEFLKLKRKELKIESSVIKFKESDIGRLINHSVLQYLDLLILAKYFNPVKELTKEKYATYLFPPTHPDYDKAVGKVNDSTTCYAERIINGNFIDSLLSSINKKEITSFTQI